LPASLLPRCAGARGHLQSWTHGATCPLTCVRILACEENLYPPHPAGLTCPVRGRRGVQSCREAGRARQVDAREHGRGRVKPRRSFVRRCAQQQYTTSNRKPYRHRPASEYRIQLSFQIELHGNASPSFAPGRQPLF
jgi:hypothetical protein